jgi:RNA polymerase sigma-70 factor (ECF subfamily)
MRMEAGLSFKEIAHIQKVSINTALARMHYAITNLRRLLSDVELAGERK